MSGLISGFIFVGLFWANLSFAGTDKALALPPMNLLGESLFVQNAQPLANKPPKAMYYRDLTNRLRPEAKFKIAMPGNGDMHFGYSFVFANPVYAQPIVSDIPFSSTVSANRFLRSFWDRIMFTDESFIEIGGEKLPLTCVFIKGQDNRFTGEASPLYPQFLLKVYLVANDYTCQGPLRPGWPESGGKKEAWDTYIYYEVRDPTIMQPVEAHVRYRWNEYSAVLLAQ